MVPRLHKRGTSFKGACNYILHDAGEQTTDRVLWTDTLNLKGPAEQGWREMHATWADRVNLKRKAGVDLRGRDNTSPVLHMTLSWHANDNPTPEHMRETALASLTAVGLDAHQAVLAAHSDKDHMHVHIVVNTVDPKTGRTAPLKYTKERLSRWAEAYEKEHGIRCEQRIENNKARDEAKTARSRDAEEILFAPSEGKPSRRRTPYVPVKDRSPNRRQWFEKDEIVERMKEMRARLEQPHKLERGVLAARHRMERDAIWQDTKAATAHARSEVRDRYKPMFRQLYRDQQREVRHLQRHNHPLERAVYVFTNRERLGHGRPLKPKEMLRLIVKPGALLDAVDRMYERKRQKVAFLRRQETYEYTDKIMARHKEKAAVLSTRQKAEREAQWTAQRAARTASTSFSKAKEELAAEREANSPPPPEREIKRGPQKERVSDAFETAARKPEPEAARPFREAAKPETLSRAEQIRRDMEAWRQRHGGRDMGREL
ncbi:MAG: relaxase/mobilization nuclease domain-containing protein [Hyphomicrobiaceae bacterium]